MASSLDKVTSWLPSPPSSENFPPVSLWKESLSQALLLGPWAQAPCSTEHTARTVSQRTVHSFFFSHRSQFMFLSKEPAFVTLFFIYLYLIYNDVLVSDVQQSDSVTHTHTHTHYFSMDHLIWYHFVFIIFFHLLATLHGMWDLNFLTRDRNPHPLHWKHKILIAGPPGKSLYTYIYVCVYSFSDSFLL